MTNKLLKHMRAIGAKGGAATKKIHGSEHFKEIGKKGREAMKKKLLG